MEFAAIDFESAGTSKGGTDAPVQIGWALMRGGEIDAGSLFESYLQCASPIAWAAQKIHGITTQDLAGAPALASLWPRLKAALGGRVVVAHGAGAEKRFLRAFPLHGFGPWLDTITLARHFFPGLTDYSLASVCDALELTAEIQRLCPAGQWHQALFDAVACLAIVQKVQSLPEHDASVLRPFIR